MCAVFETYLIVFRWRLYVCIRCARVRSRVARETTRFEINTVETKVTLCNNSSARNSAAGRSRIIVVAR